MGFTTDLRNFYAFTFFDALDYTLEAHSTEGKLPSLFGDT